MADHRKIAMAYYEKALVYQRAGDLINALAEMREAIGFDPYNRLLSEKCKEIERALDPYLLLEEIINNEKVSDYNAVLKKVELLSLLFPSDGNLNTAILAKPQTHPFASFLLPSALNYAKRKNFPAALSAILEALIIEPANQNLHACFHELVKRFKAYLLWKEATGYGEEEIELAICTAKKASDLLPEDESYRDLLYSLINRRPSIYYNLAKKYLNQGRLEDAKKKILDGIGISGADEKYMGMLCKIEARIRERERLEGLLESRKERSRSE
jgi:tetratricopeptide (TPR) repeat protein